MHLDEAVRQLYAEPLDGFMAARTALAQQAKADGDTGLAKAVASIRKPTVAAWAVNLLMRERPEEAEQLTDLAGRLQDAQERMDGPALKALGKERTTLVDTLVKLAAQVGREAAAPLSPPVVEQVRETVVAALASPPALEAATSGQLTRALSYAGFGDVDVSDALAAPAPARRPALRVVKDPPKPAARTKAKKVAVDQAPEAEEPEPPAPEVVRPDPALLQRLSLAQARSRETMTAAAAAGSALEAATSALTDLDASIAQLEQDLAAAKEQRLSLAKARAEAAAANKVADRTLRAALAEVDQVQALLPDEDDG